MLLDGADGDDSLFGNEGQDSFVTGLGDDIYEGGAGLDVIDYSGAPGGVSVDLTVNTTFNDGFGDQDVILVSDASHGLKFLNQIPI